MRLQSYFTTRTPIGDLFTNSLVLAGLCRRHSPRKRRLAGMSRHSSHAAMPMSQDIQSQEQGANRSSISLQTSDPHERDSIMSQEATKGSSIAIDQKSHNSTLPTDFTIDHAAFRRAAASKLDDTKHLFRLYLETLGKKEGLKSLQVVLSNPAREICLPQKKQPERYLPDATEIHGVQRLVDLLNDERSSNQQIFRAYKDLPSPGVLYLSARSRRLLLHRFASPPRRLRIHAERYLKLIDDMAEASFYISPSLWTAAIHLAGKSYTSVKKPDLRSSLGMWRRMEHEGLVPSSSIAFNILYDVAIKARQWKVADKIIEEMKARGLELSRFGRVAHIFSHGLRGDAEGVRKAYHEFIQLGEVVDTVVLNCVMVSLLRCGEQHVAEKMYERMKDMYLSLKSQHPELLHSTVYPSPSDNYAAYRKATKRLGRVLGMTTFLRDKLPEHHRALQRAMPLTPDGKTFHIFLWHHANVTGDLARVMALLEDMKVTFAIPPQGMIYIFLFHGFAAHGEKKDTQWTYKRLKGVWKHFLRALYHSKAELSSKRSTKCRREKFVWESPLANKAEASSRGPDSAEEADDETSKPTLYTSERGVDQASSWTALTGDGPPNPFEEDEADDDWRYENSVYLGRKLIVSCLRAHAACGGPEAVMDVWERIERLWKPESQKKADILAVKAVLGQLVPGGFKAPK
ncbi:pentatricopeptide repeat protein [Histoplasma ohiense]|nr:pentatricopeptide repeat protein [Histoplasma ohiense (nom. inval.)]